jgi:hypothetical protein
MQQQMMQLKVAGEQAKIGKDVAKAHNDVSEAKTFK